MPTQQYGAAVSFRCSSCGTARVLLAPSPSVTLRDSVEDGTCVLAAVWACLGAGSGQLPLWHCQASPAVALPIRLMGLTRVLLDVVGHKPKLDLVLWQRRLIAHAVCTWCERIFHHMTTCTPKLYGFAHTCVTHLASCAVAGRLRHWPWLCQVASDGCCRRALPPIASYCILQSFLGPA